MSTRTLVLLRHGESSANAEGLFTGVLDVPLSERGERESVGAARLLAGAGLRPDAVLTSALQRCTRTAELVVAELGLDVEPVADWRLNERNYGGLTGLTKDYVAQRYGYEQFLEWRRSLDGTPPPMDDELFAAIAGAPPFDALPPEALQRTESLRTVIVRVGTFLEDRLRAELEPGTTTLVVAHGNSLRALCLLLDRLDESAVRALNIPTGHPLVYELDGDLRPVHRGGRYVDEPTAVAAARVIAAQGGT